MIVNANSTKCSNCNSSDGCPCSLLETSGISCSDVQKKIKSNSFAAIVLDYNCRPRLLDVKSIAAENVLNEPLVLNIGNDVNGYDSSEVSLSYDSLNSKIQFDQEIVKRKFHKQVVFRVVWNPTNGSNPTITVISSQNISQAITLDVEVVSTVQFRGTFYYLKCEIVSPEWDTNKHTSVYVDNNNHYAIEDDPLPNWGVNQVDPYSLTQVVTIQNNGSSIFSLAYVMMTKHSHTLNGFVGVLAIAPYQIFGTPHAGRIRKYNITPTTSPDWITETYTPVNEIEFYVYAMQKY